MNRSASSSRPAQVKILLAFAAVYVIWGSTYLGIRYAIETLPPFLMAGSRFLTAGVILFGWSIANRDRVPSLSQWLRALLVGALLLLGGNGGVTWAEKYIASGLAALLVASEPLWVVILNWIITRTRPNFKVLLGLLIGLAGVALLVGRGLSAGGSGTLMRFVGAGAVILATLAWASGSVYTNRRPLKTSTTMASALQMMTGGGLLLLMGVLTGDVSKLDVAHVSWTSWLAFFYLTIFGSLVAFTAYSWLLKNVAPAIAATYAYVNPVVAVFLGWLIASEPITRNTIIAATIIVASVVLITTYGKQEKSQIPTFDGDDDCPAHPCA